VRVLLTNDDGVRSPGLQAIACALAERHELLVVAPDRDMSGTSAGIARVGGTKDIVFTRESLPDLDDVEVYSIPAGPGLAVLAACLEGFGERPDLVVSGINAGSNTGHSILHSGTVGAVLTGQSFGTRGLAVSAAPGPSWRWDTAVRYAMQMVAWLEALPERTALNLNVPCLDVSEVRGVRGATLDRFGTIRLAAAGDDGEAIELEIRDGAVSPEPGTDSALLAAGYATYTAIMGVAEVELGVEPDVGAVGFVERRVVPGAGDAP
jgi:5'-nucleotidase